MRLGSRAFICGASMLAAASFPALAQDRVALVIGNSQYAHASALPNPANDAREMAGALRAIGFDVAEGRDLDRTGMERQLRDFLRKASAAKVVLLFYAGHGMQVDGRNYLVPIDAKLERASDLNFETVDLDRILDTLNDTQRASIVILDACRDNPLARSFASRLGPARSGAVSTGLAGYSTLGTGTLIAFSTAPGKVALDGDGDNSPFTQALAKHLGTPGLEVRQMLTRVRADVATATRGRQVPWDNSSLLGEVYLAGLPPAPAPRATPTPADELFWEVIKESRLAALFEEFLARHPSSGRAAEARGRLDELKRAQVAAVVPPAQPPRPATPEQPQPAAGVFAPPSSARPLTPEGERSLRPKDTFKECATCPAMVVLPTGAFTMGSPESEAGREPFEGPQFQVTIGAPLAVGTFEISVDEFTAFVRDTGHAAGDSCILGIDLLNGKIKPVDGVSYAKPGYAQTGAHPAVCVSWNDATAYLAWLSKRTGKTYRLLSESEWEYAARAGSSSAFAFGDDKEAMCRHGNVADKTFDLSDLPKQIDMPGGYAELACTDGHVQAAPVGRFAANGFGLHDMHGNVSEWVQDCDIMLETGSGYTKDHPKDGAPYQTGRCLARVVRGGAWMAGIESQRSASRSGGLPEWRIDNIGFRVARPLRQTGPSDDDACFTGVTLGRERVISAMLGLPAVSIAEISKTTIDACTRMIGERRLSGTQLAIAHASLGLARNQGTADFEQALQADPGNADAYGYRAVYHLNQDDAASAIADLDKAIALAPHAGQLHAWRGIAGMSRALKVQGSAREAAQDEADAHLQRALRIDPSVFEAGVFRAMLLLERRKPKEVLDVLEPIVARGYRNVVTLALRGEAHKDLGQKALAESDFRAALAVNSDPDVKAMLERSLAEVTTR